MSKHITLKRALYTLGFLILMTGIIVTGPLQNAYGQEEGPLIPPPPRLESYPLIRDIEALGIQKSIAAPETSSVAFNTLTAGDDAIHGLVYYNNFLYASTRTSPARILKIDPDSLSVVSRASPIPANLIEADDIVQANGFIWSIATRSDTSVGRLIRVDPASMATTITIITVGVDTLDYPESMVYTFGKLWVGGYNKIAELDISTNPPGIVMHNFSTIISGNYVINTALESDSNYLYAMFLQGIDLPPSYTSSSLLRINPANPTVGYLEQPLAHLFPDDMAQTSGYLFTSNENAGQSSDAYRFPVNLTPFITETMSSSESYGVFRYPTDPQRLFGAYVGTPGRITQFDLNLTQKLTFLLPVNYDNPAEIAFDGSGNMYVATFQAPAGIVRYTIPDPVTLSISKSSLNVVLSWTNTDSLVDHYEVWRGSSPYFNPYDAGSAKLGDVSAVVGAMSYSDVSVLGDIVNNYFYVVRAVNDFGLAAPISNRVGKLERELRETVSTDFNWIALPLNANLSMASDLATYIQNNALGGVTVATIEQWNPIGQNYQTFIPPSTGNFSLQVGGVYRVSVDVAVGSSVVWPLLGRVPDIGTISYTLRKTVSTDFNWIMLPLNLSTITLASGLKANIDANAVPATTVFTIESWNVVGQNYQTYAPPVGDFSTRIGFPYRITVDIPSGSTSTWP